ncbi:hypothetical protein [Mycoavidus sp. B2-EB]|uniref:hypothetical protein n=1 Tax=Mycoavidus sp. B2-EB TaxID=2651972 RepID=UPI00351C3340
MHPATCLLTHVTHSSKRLSYSAPHTCAFSVLIALKWLDVPHKVETVKLGDPEYRKLAPLGMVPAMKAPLYGGSNKSR